MCRYCPSRLDSDRDPWRFVTLYPRQKHADRLRRQCTPTGLGRSSMLGGACFMSMRARRLRIPRPRHAIARRRLSGMHRPSAGRRRRRLLQLQAAQHEGRGAERETRPRDWSDPPNIPSPIGHVSRRDAPHGHSLCSTPALGTLIVVTRLAINGRDIRLRRVVSTLGVGGFMGSHPASACRELGYRVIGVDDMSGGFASNIPGRAHTCLYACLCVPVCAHVLRTMRTLRTQMGMT